MIRSFAHLEAVLGYSEEELHQIAESIPKFYYEFFKLQKKPNGEIKKRPITPSKYDLSDVQKRIKSRILDKIELPWHIQGGVKGRSNITNAKAHKGKKHHFCTDLKNFFPYVTSKMVYEMFCDRGFSPDIARMLARLTTYKGHLPQGTSTSTPLGNLVGLKFDNALLSICNEYKITYTRFVDDLMFSSQSDFQELTSSFIEIVNQHGFLVSNRKTKYKIGNIESTGCKIKNNYLRATDAHLIKLSSPYLKESSRIGLQKYVDRIRLA